MIKGLKIILFLIFVSLLIACSSEKKNKVLKLAHGLDMNHPVHKGMVYMAKQLEKKSGGVGCLFRHVYHHRRIIGACRASIILDGEPGTERTAAPVAVLN